MVTEIWILFCGFFLSLFFPNPLKDPKLTLHSSPKCSVLLIFRKGFWSISKVLPVIAVCWIRKIVSEAYFFVVVFSLLPEHCVGEIPDPHVIRHHYHGTPFNRFSPASVEPLSFPPDVFTIYSNGISDPTVVVCLLLLFVCFGKRFLKPFFFLPDDCVREVPDPHANIHLLTVSLLLPSNHSVCLRMGADRHFRSHSAVVSPAAHPTPCPWLTHHNPLPLKHLLHPSGMRSLHPQFSWVMLHFRFLWFGGIVCKIVFIVSICHWVMLLLLRLLSLETGLELSFV